MKTITTTAIIFALTLSAFSCKSTSKAESKNTSTAQTDLKDMIYDVIISFISKASGIDQALKGKVDAALATFNKSNKAEIKPEITHWGREGETDYNFSLKNLSTKQKKAFITSMEEIVGDTDMAHITFNQKSVHKR